MKVTALTVMMAGAVWLIEGVRVVGLVMIPTAIAGALIVLYFDWRSRLLRGSAP
jgi:hypothetical protein